jgi:hypothetical protein
MRIAEPTLDLVRLTVTHLAQHRKDPGIRGKIIEIIAVDTLDPAAIALGRSGVTHTDSHGST